METSKWFNDAILLRGWSFLVPWLILARFKSVKLASWKTSWSKVLGVGLVIPGNAYRETKWKAPNRYNTGHGKKKQRLRMRQSEGKAVMAFGHILLFDPINYLSGVYYRFGSSKSRNWNNVFNRWRAPLMYCWIRWKKIYTLTIIIRVISAVGTR